MHLLPRPLKWPAILPLQKNLLVWLSFDDRSGAYVKDRSGHGHRGTITNATWQAWNRQAALNLDGASDLVTIPYHADLNFMTEDFSLLLAFRTSVLAKLNLFANGYDSNRGYEMILRNDGKIWFRTNQAAASQTTQAAAGDIAINTDYVVVTTRDGAAAKIYINGLDKTATPVDHINPKTSGTDLTIGKGASYAVYLTGIVWMAAVWSRCLTAVEAKRISEFEFWMARH